MRIDVLTIFPAMFDALKAGLVGKAFESGAAELCVHDIRNFSGDERGTVDDRPYGGGPGMVMKVEPIFMAVESVRARTGPSGPPPAVLVMSPQGERHTQEKAKRLSSLEHIIFVCGRYEGIDERVTPALGAEEISVGDYVLCGGELPAMVIIESVVRLLPGTLGDSRSAEDESFADCLLEYPQYTRPPEFRGLKVPPVLLSGNHEQVRKWRRIQALRRTTERRGDLFSESELSDADRMLMREIRESGAE